MCPGCRAFITTSDRVCPYCQAEVGPRAVDVRNPGEILGGLIPQANLTAVIILTLNFGLYVASMAGNVKFERPATADIHPNLLLLFGAKVDWAALQASGQWWRLITAGFLHGGLFHIFMNSWALWDLAGVVEEYFGTARLVVFYVFSTVCGFALSALWSASISVGASAAIMGLIGAMIALGTRSGSAMVREMRGFFVRWAIYSIMFGLLPMFPIDNAAHIGGLAGGYGIAMLAGEPSLRNPGRERLWRMLGGVSAAIALACLLLVILRVFSAR